MSKWDKFSVERAEGAGGGVTIFRLAGVLTNTRESYDFLDHVQEETRKKPMRLVLNLSGLEHLTSAGLGIIAACFTSVTRSGGRMCLAGAEGRVRVILNVMRMLDVIDNAPTEEEAVQKASA
jgi:anti-anti-sigma factor